MSDEEIRGLLRKVDDRVLAKIHHRDQSRKAVIWYFSGLVLAISGILLIVARNAGLFMTSRPSWILYPVFFAGIAFMIHARTLKRKTRMKTPHASGAIRRKRPFK
jgi:positive regulator of sigma E activity